MYPGTDKCPNGGMHKWTRTKDGKNVECKKCGRQGS